MKLLRFLTMLFLLFAVITLQAQDMDGLPKLYPAYSEDFSYSSSFPSTCFQYCFQDKDGSVVYYLNGQEAWFYIQNTGDHIVRFNFRNNTAKKYYFSDFKPEGIPAGEEPNLIIPGTGLNQLGDFYVLKAHIKIIRA